MTRKRSKANIAHRLEIVKTGQQTTDTVQDESNKIEMGKLISLTLNSATLCIQTRLSCKNVSRDEIVTTNEICQVKITML